MPQRACPKCGHEQPDYHTECAQCGIIFSKYSSQREAFARAQASQTLPPQKTGVRPFTLFLLVAYLILGWVAINRLGVVDKLALFVTPEEGISSGGSIIKRARQRVEVTDEILRPAATADQATADAATAPPDEEPPALETCHGLPLMADAELLEGAPTGATWYETGATLDDALAFYRGFLGPTRMVRDTQPVPANSSLAATRELVNSRHARWQARYVDPEGNATDVDVELLSPFFEHDGSFAPGSTRFAFAVPIPETVPETTPEPPQRDDPEP